MPKTGTMFEWCSAATERASRRNRFSAAGSANAPRGKDLQGHLAPERLLDCLVHHAHAAAADLADDPEVAQPVRHEAIAARRWVSGGVKGRRVRTGLLDSEQGGKDLADLFGELGMFRDVLGHGRTLAPPVSFEEFLGQNFHGIAHEVRVGHRGPPARRWPERWPSIPGPSRRIGLSRFSART